MSPKILLVDDREDNLISIEAILAPMGYQFVRANSGRQALRVLLTEFEFAMILMDVRMPNLNGFETAALIYEREKLKHIPIIFITANNYGDENMYKGYQSGAIDYIFKPIHPDILRAKVGILVELYKKNRLLSEQERKLIAVNMNLQREIEERKANEDKVKRLNQRLLDNISSLESANKDLERFAFMASHDLQEPLRKIRLFSDRLFKKYSEGSEEDAKAISRIQKAAERMHALIIDILSFSKLSTDTSNFLQTDLNTVLADILAEVKEDVGENKIKFSVEPMPSLFVNRNLISILLQNLISNAVKYRRKDVETKIIIRHEISSGFNGQSKNLVDKYCRIFVEDNGIGIDSRYSEEIFGMFKRLHRNNEYSGTGVGLALCKKIAEIHNGHIAVRSKVGEGSTFIFSVPVMQEK